MRKLKDFKNKMLYRKQRAKKGYCDEDLYSIFNWFIKIFPKMLGEFAECTFGYPCKKSEMIAEVDKMPCDWIIEQQEIIEKNYKKNKRTIEKIDVKDSMTCWLLIILRMKYCFEHCDEWHEDYEKYNESKNEENWSKQYELMEKYKKEGFYLLEKYFFTLWW